MSATVDTGAAHRAAVPPETTSPATPAAAATLPSGDDGERVEMVREVGLDGLRGLAVAAVVVFHLDRLQGGFLGVDLFFVLSGYLITSLLLREVGAAGSVGLGGFWARRARRLLPALALVVVGIAGLLLAFTPQGVRAGFRGEVLATIGYVANWQRVFADTGYWDMFDQASPFDHMWSLAIEEQFYVVWPLVVVGLAALVRRVGRLSVSTVVVGVGVVGAGLSLLGLAVAYDPIDTNWAYFSTPTRLGPTLLGAALAGVVVDRPRRPGPPGRPWDLAALAGLAVMGWLMVDVDGLGPRYYQGGLLVFTLAGLVVVRAVTGGPPGLVARALATPPLRALGIISYGVYLWHWPVIVYLTDDRAHLDGIALDLLRVAVTLVAATVSYLVVERPIRRGVLRGRRMVVAAGLTLFVTLAAGVIATYGTPVDRTGGDIPDGPLAGTDTLFLHVPETVPPGARRILLLGDSGVQYLGPELIDAAADSGAAVAFSSEVECTAVNPEGITLQTDGEIARREPCHDHRRELWQRLAEEFDPDVVVLYMANAGGIASVRLDDRWVRDCDPAYDAYVEDSVRHDLDLVTPDGAPVVLMTAPYIAVIDGSSGDRVDCRNELLHDIADTRPATDIVDLNGFVLTQVGAGEDMFVDSVHLSPTGGRLVSEWLLPTVLVPE
jgi:peptidoglycan/LPS O-acetylase OafA/YrhL